MTDAGHLLLLLLLAPLIGALAMLTPGSLLATARQAWTVALLSSLATLGVALAIAAVYYTGGTGGTGGTGNTADAVLAVDYPWAPTLGLRFTLQLDGLSLWLILTSAVITPVVLIFLADKLDRAFDTGRQNPALAMGPDDANANGDGAPSTGPAALAAWDRYRQYFFWLMLTEFAVLGAFLARDLVLFYAFFELSIIPAFFLIYSFGGAERKQAATTMLLYNVAASLLSFTAILYLAAHHYRVEGAFSFALDDLRRTAPLLGLETQTLVLLGLLAGFLVKTPLWPIHTWLPNAHREAPGNGVVDAATLVIKLGPYAILVFALPLAPDAAVRWAPCIAGLGIVGILVAGLVAWVEPNIKKLLGYASVSHMGFCVIGLFAFDPDALGAAGAAFYIVVYGLSAGALFLCAGILHDRLGTLDTAHVEGTATTMPGLAFFAVFFAMVSVGLPGLSGFVGEFLAMVGTFSLHGRLGPVYALFAVLGVIVTAIYLLGLVGKVIYGPSRLPRQSHNRPLRLSAAEVTALAVPAVLCLALGLYPRPVLDAITPVTQQATAPARTALANEFNQTPPPRTRNSVVTTQPAEPANHHTTQPLAP